MKKKILILGLCGLLLTGCGNIAVLKNGEEAVVTLKDDEGISVDNLYQELKDKYAISILINMIDTEILNKEYPDAGKEKDTYIENYLSAVKANYTDETFLSALQQSGFSTEDEFKEYIGLNYLRNEAIVDYAKTLVTNKEIKEYYEDKTVGDIKCSHILISVTTTDEMTDEEKTKADTKALNEAKTIIEELNKAKDVKTKFAEIAKEKSTDTASAKNGGDLGFFNTGEMYQEFETAAYALKKGEYSKTPVKTSVGYHIILKTDEKAKASLDDSKENIIKKLADEKVSADTTLQVTALTELRKQYDMKIEDSELSKQYSNYIQNSLASSKEN